jgi:hypothetical protein
MSGITPLLSHVPSCCASEVLTVVTAQINAFWDVVLCTSAHQYQYVTEVSSTLKMDATHYSKVLLPTILQCAPFKNTVFSLLSLVQPNLFNNGVFIVHVSRRHTGYAYKIGTQK